MSFNFEKIANEYGIKLSSVIKLDKKRKEINTVHATTLQKLYSSSIFDEKGYVKLNVMIDCYLSDNQV